MNAQEQVNNNSRGATVTRKSKAAPTSESSTLSNILYHDVYDAAIVYTENGPVACIGDIPPLDSIGDDVDVQAKELSPDILGIYCRFSGREHICWNSRVSPDRRLAILERAHGKQVV